MKLTVEQIKQLTTKYPYIIPRNLFTDEIVKDYNYTWTIADNLPTGWTRLFLLWCKNANKIMSDKEINTFRFSDVKQKYGTMRLNNFGATEAVHRLITKYEAYSYNICSCCGKLATRESMGWWIESYCRDCSKNVKAATKPLKHKHTLHIIEYNKGKKHHHFYPLWRVDMQYKKCLKMNDTKFINYILEE